MKGRGSKEERFEKRGDGGKKGQRSEGTNGANGGEWLEGAEGLRVWGQGGGGVTGG